MLLYIASYFTHTLMYSVVYNNCLRWIMKVVYLSSLLLTTQVAQLVTVHSIKQSRQQTNKQTITRLSVEPIINHPSSHLTAGADFMKMSMKKQFLLRISPLYKLIDLKIRLTILIVFIVGRYIYCYYLFILKLADLINIVLPFRG